MRRATIHALEIRDEADTIRSLTRGDLEAQVLAAERAQATAPPDVSRRLRLTAQAEADAWQQTADATTRHAYAEAANAKALAGRLAIDRQQLEADNAHYERWFAAAASIRKTAAKAQAELERRGPTSQEPGDRRIPDRQAVRASEMLSLAIEAADRIAAERQARADYSSRIKRESQAQLEKEAHFGVEMEP
jgi:hypothetical protein